MHHGSRRVVVARSLAAVHATDDSLGSRFGLSTIDNQIFRVSTCCTNRTCRAQDARDAAETVAFLHRASKPHQIRSDRLAAPGTAETNIFYEIAGTSGGASQGGQFAEA